MLALNELLKLDNMFAASKMYLRGSLEKAADSVLFGIRAYVYATRTANCYTVSYPDGWWQAFKKENFPKWLLRKFPVRYYDHKFHTKVLLPDFKDLPVGRSKFKQVTLLQSPGHARDYWDHDPTGKCEDFARYTPIGRMVVCPTVDELAEFEYKFLEKYRSCSSIPVIDVIAWMDKWTQEFFDPDRERN